MFFHSRSVITSVTNNNKSCFSLHHQLNSKPNFYADLLIHLVSDDCWNNTCICFYPFTRLIQTLVLEQLSVCMSLHCKSAADIKNVCGQTAAACGAWKGAKHKRKEGTTKIIPFAWTSLWGRIWWLSDVIPIHWLRLSNHSSPEGSAWTTPMGKKELKCKQRKNPVKVNSKSCLIHAPRFI